jgi:uncharacterized protein involved in exopolysaccharide biosynthesis
VDYLSSQLPLANSTQVQQSMGRLLDEEIQTVMLAKGNPEYAFVVVDPPKIPKQRSSPKRTLMTLIGGLAGFFFGLLALFVRKAIEGHRKTNALKIQP